MRGFAAYLVSSGGFDKSDINFVELLTMNLEDLDVHLRVGFEEGQRVWGRSHQVTVILLQNFMRGALWDIDLGLNAEFLLDETLPPEFK